LREKGGLAAAWNGRKRKEERVFRRLRAAVQNGAEISDPVMIVFRFDVLFVEYLENDASDGDDDADESDDAQSLDEL
jgi:hypothetical protein